jgi:hypothetical protein
VSAADEYIFNPDLVVNRNGQPAVTGWMENLGGACVVQLQENANLYLPCLGK